MGAIVWDIISADPATKIKNPATRYGTWYVKNGHFYINTWSVNNTILGSNDTPVVKSVYDPCPPGFAVPYKNFAGNLGTRSTASDGSGVYYTASNGAAQFFPYSGSRIYYSANPSTMAAVTPGIYINELANSGLYWTDCPLNIAVNSSYNASNNWAGCGPYQNFQFAYIISMAASASSTIQFTRGTAGTIRPVVYEDPNY